MLDFFKDYKMDNNPHDKPSKGIVNGLSQVYLQGSSVSNIYWFHAFPFHVSNMYIPLRSSSSLSNNLEAKIENSNFHKAVKYCIRHLSLPLQSQYVI